MAQILLIDDDPSAARVLEEQVASEGHALSVAKTPSQAERSARDRLPDVVLLELGLQNGSGKDLLRTLRKMGTFPVVVVTRLSDEIDRVVAFELGADDYVVKPFSARELALRIRALLRRRQASDQRDNRPGVGQVRLDGPAFRVWVGDRRLELSPLEFKLLRTLCDEPQRVLSREELLQAVWGSDITVGVRTVDAYIKRVRSKLGSARHVIQTVRGVGYRLLPDLDPSPDGPKAS